MEKSSSTPTTSRCSTSLTFELPYPPSTNTYWRRVGNRTLLSRAARKFRKRVADLWLIQKTVFQRKGLGRTPVAVELIVHPPDRRKRDIDNLIKPVLDAIQAAGVIEDDSQVALISIRRSTIVPGGLTEITISEHERIQND